MGGWFITGLFYVSHFYDALGSVIGLEGQDGSMSARYRYDEFGVAEAPEKFDLNGSGPDNLFGYTSLGMITTAATPMRRHGILTPVWDGSSMRIRTKGRLIIR